MKPLIWMLIALFIVPILWNLSTTRSRFREKSLRIAEYTRKHGYALLNPSAASVAEMSFRDMLNAAPPGGWVRATEGITDLEDFKDGTDYAALAFVCRLRGRDVTICNFESNPPIGTQSLGPSYKVAKIAQEGLPRFFLCRHSVVEKVRELVDRTTGQPDSSLDQGKFPEFFKHHYLKGLDGAAVYAFLSPSKLHFLEQQTLAGILAANPHYLVYYESGVMRTAADYDRFIAAADGLIAGLL